MNHDDPLLVSLPDDLSDEVVANLLEFLYELARAIESRYTGQLHRYYQQPDQRQTDFWQDTDPRI